MATEDAERSPQLPDETGSETSASEDVPVTRGRYSWRTLLSDRGHADAAEALYANIGEEPAIPASAVAAHAPDGGERVIRAADVDEASEKSPVRLTRVGEVAAGDTGRLPDVRKVRTAARRASKMLCDA
jgi:hypothetical protein